MLSAQAGAVLAGSHATAVVAQLRTDPLTALPGVGIARVLAERPDELRVWNDYNTSGSLIAFGGGRLRLRIDGRADLWGSEGIARQVGVQRLDAGWEEELRRFDPDVVVLAADAPLTTLLVREGTWRITARDRTFVLLEPAGRSPE